MQQRVLITGATGFIGGAIAHRWLAQGLAHPGDVEVRVLVRNPEAPRALELAARGARLVVGDLRDAASLEQACVGCDVVVHAATDTELSDRGLAWQISVEGSRQLYAAAARAGVSRFLFISSFIVYGGLEAALSEDVTPVAFGDLYGDVKIAAEKDLTEASSAPGMPQLTILRLPSVYGAQSPHWTLKPLDAARRNRVYLPGGGRFGFPYLYIDNLVAAVTRAVLSERYGVYNIFDGMVAYGEYMAYYCSMAGTRPRNVPLALLFVAGWVGGILSALTGRYIPLTLRNVRKIAKPMSDTPFTPEKARRELGWEPLVSLEAGMAAIRADLSGHPA